MPWNRTDEMQERVKFALEWERRWDEARGGRVDMAELCRIFGVSRQTGYVWLRRYRQANHDVRALENRSCRPRTSPNAVREDVQDFLVAARKHHPRWGARKLRAWLLDRYSNVPVPSASAIAAILKRRGLIAPRRRRRARGEVISVTAPFGDCSRSSAVWCVDFKGWFRTGDGAKCHPLTLVDAHSRYLLRCEIVEDPNGRRVQEVFDSAFQEFGLPRAIRSDNGPPFAARGPAGLSRLAVWLLRLEIELQRIQPGKPQQNGRQERLHLTLKLDVPIARSLRAQQRAFDSFRAEYNHERPHEALGMKPPAHIYRRSHRRYPRALLLPDPPLWAHAQRTDGDGFIRWKRRRIFISSALSGEMVGLVPIDGPRWQVYFGSILLGTVDESHPERGLLPDRSPRAALRKLRVRDEAETESPAALPTAHRIATMPPCSSASTLPSLCSAASPVLTRSARGGFQLVGDGQTAPPAGAPDSGCPLQEVPSVREVLGQQCQ